MKDLSLLWEQVKRILLEAQRQLPLEDAAGLGQHAPNGFIGGTQEEFEEFLENNEYELAWDALASMALRVNVSSAFWDNLASSAAMMELGDKEREALRKADELRGN